MDRAIALDCLKKERKISRIKFILDVQSVKHYFFLEICVARHIFSRKTNSEFSRICNHLERV